MDISPGPAFQQATPETVQQNMQSGADQGSRHAFLWPRPSETTAAAESEGPADSHAQQNGPNRGGLSRFAPVHSATGAGYATMGASAEQDADMPHQRSESAAERRLGGPGTSTDPLGPGGANAGQITPEAAAAAVAAAAKEVPLPVTPEVAERPGDHAAPFVFKEALPMKPADDNGDAATAGGHAASSAFQGSAPYKPLNESKAAGAQDGPLPVPPEVVHQPAFVFQGTAPFIHREAGAAAAQPTGNAVQAAGSKPQTASEEATDLRTAFEQRLHIGSQPSPSTGRPEQVTCKTEWPSRLWRPEEQILLQPPQECIYQAAYGRL